ncbi:uncharacterized protein LOC77798 isoform 2 [Mus musculus]|uniref:uncharacterized protein LOC77798 isoform 2 n=1 Tax=Mus musculus TaxID=10090 RepID=UPI0003D6F326|nr:uncharacterized protein LOC77798 isoform 2 [Mus musculus]|eukprot:XP_017169652.1 PREDICTED: uncharacterized protein LOC77798 isoform X1 [Mus musculus]
MEPTIPATFLKNRPTSRNNQYSLRTSNQLYLFTQRVPENNSCSHKGGGRCDVTLGRVMPEASPRLLRNSQHLCLSSKRVVQSLPCPVKVPMYHFCQASRTKGSASYCY